MGAHVLEQVIASMSPVAEKKGLGLLVTLPASLSPLVSDERRVRQVILNLVNNAIKFTQHGEISVTVAVSTDEAPLVRIRVADTGVGIGQENLAILFQPFRQIDSGLTRHVEGTGLGLAICRQLAGLLGGTVEAQSQPGAGSVFTVTLPIRGVDNQNGRGCHHAQAGLAPKLEMPCPCAYSL
jgi:signal transduction histidine kinase